MKNLIKFISKILSAFNMPANLIVIAPIITSATMLVIFIIGIFSKKIRRINKSALLTSALAQYSIIFSKAVYDAINAYSPMDEIEKIIAGSVFVSISFLISTALTIQSLSTNMNKSQNIDLNYLDDLPEKSNIPQAFAQNPFRRAEKLETYKMFWNDNGDLFEPNYSEILSYVEKIRKKHPDRTDEDELDKIELDIDRYHGREITDYERKNFSSKLSVLIKLLSKYEVG